MSRYRAVLLAVVAIGVLAVSGTASAHSSKPGLDVSVAPAPVAPDGTVAGAPTDIVVTFANRDPRVDGIGLKAGATVEVVLPDAFVADRNGANSGIILQGWPQSPPVLSFPPPVFLWSTSVTGNTIKLTLTHDYLPGAFGPGPKQVHLLLLGFSNPKNAGKYPIMLAITPDPKSAQTLQGTGKVKILPRVRPSIQPFSALNGMPPPPFPNAIYQTVNAGDAPLPWGFYLWDGAGGPHVGADIVKQHQNLYWIVSGKGHRVGWVKVRPPRGATAHEVTTSGPAAEVAAFATGLPTALLEAQFAPDPKATGDYQVIWHMSGGTTQWMFVTVVAPPKPQPPKPPPPKPFDNKTALVQGAPLVGGTNGIAFDPDNNLWTAQVLGSKIGKLDPETGEITGGLGLAEGVLFPDDVTVGADGTVYWTDPGVGAVFRHPPGGPTEPVISFFGLPSANPIALSDDGKRLFAAGCFDAGPNSLVEVDLETLDVRPILTDQPGCASNSFDFIVDGKGEAIYGPRWFEGRVVRIDVATGAITDVTTDWGFPAAAKFDSKGNLYAANQGNGEVVKIDLANPDTTANRELVAQLPAGWIDNIIFDKDDRLYISSAGEATVLEILPGGKFRTVSPGGMNIATGIAVLGDTVYAINLGTMFSFNTRTGNDAGVTRSIFGVGPLQAPTTVARWGKRLVLMSALSGSLMVWDAKAGEPVFTTTAALPIDAQPFQGDLIWTETATGNVVRGSGPELADREILGTFDGPTGLAATHDDLYVSVAGTGEVLQLIADGKLLGTPAVIASGLTIPEGLALHRANTRLLVVDGGTQTLEEIYLKSGNRRTIASELGFSPAIPGVGAFGWFNNIEVDRRGHMFVNGDAANVIWKITRGHSGKKSGWRR